MNTLKQGQREHHRLGRHRVTFEGARGPNFHITDGELIKRLQRGDEVPDGTLVRVTHHDDRGSWFEIWRVVEIKSPQLAGAVA